MRWRHSVSELRAALAGDPRFFEFPPYYDNGRLAPYPDEQVRDVLPYRFDFVTDIEHYSDFTEVAMKITHCETIVGRWTIEFDGLEAHRFYFENATDMVYARML